MEGLKLNCDKAEGALDRIIEDYKVVAPKRIAGKGRFSDMDLVSYDMVESLSDIVFNDRTYFSAKSQKPSFSSQPLPLSKLPHAHDPKIG